MDLVRWVNAQHRNIRTAFETGVLQMLPPEKLIARPAGANSIAWLMWHLARLEDVVVNPLIQGKPQLLEQDGWQDRIGTSDLRVGTGFGDDEVESFGASADPMGIDAYWKAVHETGALWLKGATADDLDVVVDVEALKVNSAPLTSHMDDHLATLWGGRPAGWVFNTSVILHGYLHVGEMITIRGLLGVQGFL